MNTKSGVLEYADRKCWGQDNEIQDQRIEKLVKLAEKNYQRIFQYFQGQIPSSDSFQNQYQCQLLSDKTMTAHNIAKLQYYLTEIHQQINSTFTNQSLNTNSQCGEYKFLRNLWAGHKHRMQRRSEAEERIDGINQVVSMIKLRMRSLTHKTHLKMLTQDYSQQSPIELQTQLFFNHPLFEKMNQQLGCYTMELEQIKQKYSQCKIQRQNISEECQKMKTKLQQLKQKNKKSDRAIFDLTKAKVKLQKKVFDLQSNESKENSFCISFDKENQLNNQSDQIQNQNKRKFQRKKKPLTQSVGPMIDRKQRLQDQVARQMAQKFKNMRKFNHKKQNSTCFSPDTSMESVRTLRFERNNSKKSLINCELSHRQSAAI